MNSARLLFAAAVLLGPVVSSPAGNLSEVAQSPKYAWSGVVVSKAGRIFVEFPEVPKSERQSLRPHAGSKNPHARGAVGLSDGQVRGGHLLEAIAFPTLEVFFTALPATLIKKRDEETTLSLFDLNPATEKSLP